MATGIGQGRERKQGDKEGPGPRYCVPSAPAAATSPPLHTTGALAFHLSLPPSLCPAVEALQLSSTPSMLWIAGREGDLQDPDAHSGPGCLDCRFTAACHFPFSGDCSSPPGQVVAHCAAGDGRATTAAALAPSAAAQRTARAWPAAGELLTLGQRGKLAGPGKEQQRAGDEELRSRAEGEEEGCWGGSQLGRVSG